MKAKNKLIAINLLFFFLLVFILPILVISEVVDPATATDPAATTTVTTPTKTDTQSDVATLLYPLEAPLGDTYYVTNLNEYIVIVYKFAVSAAAILATIVIMFGGLSWAASAGNEQRITSAKETIIGAIVGLILAVGSYLILTTINPSLSSLAALNVLKIPMSAFVSSSSSNTSGSKCTWGYSPSNGYSVTDFSDLCVAKDKPETTTDCAGDVCSTVEASCFCPDECLTEELRDDHKLSANCEPAYLTNAGAKTCLGSDTEVEKAAVICQGESGGNKASVGPIKCTDGTPVIYGIFQFNLVAHNSSTTFPNCRNLLTINKDAEGHTVCNIRDHYHDSASGEEVWYCKQYDCSLAAGADWTKCQADVQNIYKAVTEMCRIKASGGWSPNWSWNTEHCGWD